MLAPLAKSQPALRSLSRRILLKKKGVTRDRLVVSRDRPVSIDRMRGRHPPIDGRLKEFGELNHEAWLGDAEARR
eukprot:1063798-Prymnesium_polylepis.1